MDTKVSIGRIPLIKFSGKPFKSGLAINTAIAIDVHPTTSEDACKFIEDDTYVEIKMIAPVINTTYSEYVRRPEFIHALAEKCPLLNRQDHYIWVLIDERPLLVEGYLVRHKDSTEYRFFQTKNAFTKYINKRNK